MQYFYGRDDMRVLGGIAQSLLILLIMTHQYITTEWDLAIRTCQNV